MPLEVRGSAALLFLGATCLSLAPSCRFHYQCAAVQPDPAQAVSQLPPDAEPYPVLLQHMDPSDTSLIANVLAATVLRAGIEETIRALPRAEPLPEDLHLEWISLGGHGLAVCDGYTYSAAVSTDGRYWIHRQGGIAGRLELFGPASLTSIRYYSCF